MKSKERPEAISDPKIMGGVPCLKGTRIPMEAFKNLKLPEIVERWSHLTYDQVIYVFDYWHNV